VGYRLLHLKVIANVHKVAEHSDNYLGIWDISSAEKRYLANALKQVEISDSASKVTASIPIVSNKVTKLMAILAQEAFPEFSGIVFVQERATTEILAHLLSIHPATRDLFRVGTAVGTSAHSLRARNVAELVDLEAQKLVLSRFRSGAINLVVATSVLEEGTDVPACNVVVCFEKPANLKSFVQRRGRARQRDSKLILLLDSMADKLGEYEQLELDMRRIYEDEMRKLQELLVLEDGEEQDGRYFRVERTGALLDLDNALPHLYHFCATLPAKEYVNRRPEFICSGVGAGLRARANLPLSVDAAARTTESQNLSLSGKNAIKDAAFEAYVALYKAGLVNDNLLPLLRHDEITDELTSSTVEKRASIMSLNELRNPWIDIAKAWKDGEASDFRKSTLSVDDLETEIYLPLPVPRLPQFQLYCDSKTEVPVCPSTASIQAAPKQLQEVLNEGLLLLKATFGERFPIQQKQPVMLFSTKAGETPEDFLGCQAIVDGSQSQLQLASAGLIGDTWDNHVAYIYRGWLPYQPSIINVQNPYKRL
jgi:hypothetical protein